MFGLLIVVFMVHFIVNLNIKNRVFKIISLIVFIEIIICLLEISTDFRMSISAYSKNIIYFGRVYTDTNLSEAFYNVLSGFHWNTNDLASSILIVIPFFLLHKNIYIKNLGFLVCCIILFFIYSRACISGLFFLFFCYLLFFKKKIFLLLFPVVIIISLIFLYDIDYLVAHNNQILNKISELTGSIMHYMSTNYVGGDSIGIRQRLIMDGIHVWLSHNVLLGIGGGSSKAIQQMNNQDIVAMHNFWIEILVEVGPLFLFLFLFWCLLVLFKLYRIQKNTKNIYLKYYASSVFLSIISFFPSSISMSSAIYYFPMYIMFGFALVTLNNYKRLKKNENINIE